RGAVVLADDDDGPAQLLVALDAGLHLALAREVLEGIIAAPDLELAIGGHAPFRHLGDELVLMPLADELRSGLDVEAVVGGQELHAANLAAAADEVDGVDALANKAARCRPSTSGPGDSVNRVGIFHGVDVGDHRFLDAIAEDGMEDGPEAVRAEE